MKQELLDTARTGRFELLLEPGFQCRVSDFDGHWLLLVSIIRWGDEKARGVCKKARKERPRRETDVPCVQWGSCLVSFVTAASRAAWTSRESSSALSW